MTVLRPSLPPVSWTTTRMVSLAPGVPASGAAAAVRPRNVGTVRPQATRLEVFEKLAAGLGHGHPPLSAAWTRRLSSLQLKLRQRQHQMAQGPDRMVRAPRRRSRTRAPPASAPERSSWSGVRGSRRHVPLQEQVEEESDDASSLAVRWCRFTSSAGSLRRENGCPPSRSGPAPGSGGRAASGR